MKVLVWILKSLNWALDRMIAFFEWCVTEPGCEHSKPACEKCKRNWDALRMSAGGW